MVLSFISACRRAGNGAHRSLNALVSLGLTWETANARRSEALWRACREANTKQEHGGGDKSDRRKMVRAS